jgi:type IV pilus assembly protein PilB
MAGGIEQHDKEEYFPGLAYLKAVAGLDVDDKRRPQSGVFSVKIEGDTYNWRIDTAGNTRGEKMILTFIEQTDVIDVDSIGFNFDQIDSVKEKLAEKRGIFVVSGPKGSGVSSMLYSMIRNHDGFTENIFSYEKELLCEIDNITQNLVESEDVSDDAYHKGLRSIFLADPDAVMVGFCKNEQMAKGATDYVHDEKQKKLYIANEAPTVFHALQNWIKMVGDAKKTADTLSVVTCQRLVRKLCTHCREAYIPDPALLKKLNLPSEKIKHFYRPPTEEEIDKNGEPILCENCQGIGYYGRTAVIETLILTDDLKAMIAKKAPVNTLRVQCRKEKMLYMQEQALRKVIKGVTSIQEVSRVTNEAKPKAKKPASKT